MAESEIPGGINAYDVMKGAPIKIAIDWSDGGRFVKGDLQQIQELTIRVENFTEKTIYLHATNPMLSSLLKCSWMGRSPRLKLYNTKYPDIILGEWPLNILNDDFAYFAGVILPEEGKMPAVMEYVPVHPRASVQTRVPLRKIFGSMPVEDMDAGHLFWLELTDRFKFYQIPAKGEPGNRATLRFVNPPNHP